MTLDHRGMNTGSFIFGQKIKFFMIFKGFPCSGGGRPEEPCLVIYGELDLNYTGGKGGTKRQVWKNDLRSTGAAILPAMASDIL